MPDFKSSFLLISGFLINIFLLWIILLLYVKLSFNHLVMFNHRIERVKLVADYPANIFPIGKIFELKNEDCGVVFHEYTDAEPIHIDKEFCLKYKHLFKILEWFEDRPENELPKIVNYGWEGRERVPVTIKDFKQGFTWLNSERQYLCHAIPVWE